MARQQEVSDSRKGAAPGSLAGKLNLCTLKAMNRMAAPSLACSPSSHTRGGAAEGF
jgi:hypothetical protein